MPGKCQAAGKDRPANASVVLALVDDDRAAGVVEDAFTGKYDCDPAPSAMLRSQPGSFEIEESRVPPEMWLKNQVC